MAEAAPVRPALALEEVGFAFGASPVVSDITLQLPSGTFFSLLGPSGGGKTTLLKLIGGYLRPTRGHIFLGESNVTTLPPERRDIGMVFQSFALFPHLTARQNVAFGLEMRRVPRPERQRRVEAMLDRVGLSAAERGRRPAQLSGGQQQRVALARALVIEPKLLLMDEPLANLDRQLREQLRGELKELQRRSGVTTLLVTHDREEALTLSDQVGILVAGRLLQTGTPEEVYRRPRCPFVARLLGDANFFCIEAIDAEHARLEGGLLVRRDPVPVASWRVGDRLMVRPEHCRIRAVENADAAAWRGRVAVSSYLGCDQMVEVAVTADRNVRVRRRTEANAALATPANVAVEIPPGAFWALPEADPDWLTAAGKGGANARA